MNKQQAIKELRQIPGIGPSMAEDLWELGYPSIPSLRDQDPEAMYERHCRQKGQIVDRCVLYVFRCAVYYATEAVHDPELLKWWKWKDS